MTAPLSAPRRSDPIQEKYFRPVERADAVSNWLFVSSALSSFISLFVDKAQHPGLNQVMATAFILGVLAQFVLGIVVRLSLTPRAEDRRREDLLSKSFSVSLTQDRTQGYYNNDQTEPLRSLGVSTLENTLFTKAIGAVMARDAFAWATAYVAVYLSALTLRGTSPDAIVWATQVVFSEQMFSRAIRLAWLWRMAERAHNDLHSLFLSKPPKAVLGARILQAATFYETSKANAAILLSSRLFRKMNPALSQEWEKIKAELKL